MAIATMDCVFPDNRIQRLAYGKLQRCLQCTKMLRRAPETHTRSANNRNPWIKACRLLVHTKASAMKTTRLHLTTVHGTTSLCPVEAARAEGSDMKCARMQQLRDLVPRPA